MDTLRTMQIFVAVVDGGSQAAAAQHLDLSRPVVSRAIAALEQWAGARLLHRTTRRLGLTAAGDVALARCRRMLEIAGEMQHAADTVSERPQGLLRVTAASAFGQAQLTRILSDFMHQEPGVAIDLLLLDRTVNLVEERVDVAIRIASELDPSLIARKLAACRSVVCASPAYLASLPAIRTPQDLSAHNCLTHSHYGKSLWNFEVGGHPVAVAVSGTLTANDSIALAQAAQNGAGIAMLPTFVAAPFIAAGALVTVLPEVPLATQNIYAVYASRRHMSSALRSLLDFLAAQLPSEPAWDAVFKPRAHPRPPHPRPSGGASPGNAMRC